MIITATSSLRRDVENYQQIGYQDDEHADDLERLQGRLITEDAMNMMDHDKGINLTQRGLLCNLHYTLFSIHRYTIQTIIHYFCID